MPAPPLLTLMQLLAIRLSPQAGKSLVIPRTRGRETRSRYASSMLIATHHGRNDAATDDVNMKMKHFLPAALAGVDHSTKTIVQSLFFCQLGCQQQHIAEQGGMGIFGLHQRSQMKLGDQHEVHRRDRMDVMKGEQLIVFIHLATRNFTACDFAK